MIGLFGKLSLRTRLLAASAAASALSAGAACAVGASLTAQPEAGDGAQLLRICLAAGGAGLLGLAALAVRVHRLLRPLTQLRAAMESLSRGDCNPSISTPAPYREAQLLQQSFERLVQSLDQTRHQHEQAKRSLDARSQTVDRLLEFSQTIQGAGKSEQILDSLSHFLRTELSLTHIVVAAHDPDSFPVTQLRVCRPDDLDGQERLAEMDAALCPCLRQNQPRNFRPECSPVRCSIEQCLSLPPANPAYCIPFHVGRKTQVVVHMLLPPEQSWTESRRQLAQTYVNAAHSALVSLQLLAEAEQQSMTDALTGLYNRRSMEQLLQREVALADRHARPMSLAIIDMDLFKQINDAHGHAAGDHLLRSFADCVRMTLRKTDLAFRYGGDEFVIALPQTNIAQAQQVVQKLRQAYAAVDFSDAIANLKHQPTLSIGVAERSAAMNLTTLSAVISAADQALYDAKNDNRDCVKTYQPKAA